MLCQILTPSMQVKDGNENGWTKGELKIIHAAMVELLVEEY